MKKIRLIAMFSIFLVSSTTFSQVPFTTGNLVVTRTGDGVAPLNSFAAPVFLDEYTPQGSLVQSIPLPTSSSGSNNTLTLRGTAITLGTLTLSPDGRYLAMIGYNLSPAGTDLSGSARTVALIDYNAIINTSTSLTDCGTSEPISAVTSDGGNIWVGLTLFGSRYAVAGAATSTLIANSTSIRMVSISNGQLYDFSSGGLVRSIGTGLPTTGPQTVSVLPGMSAIGNIGQTFFADLNPSIPGVDVLYVVNLSNAAIQKFSFDGTTWSSNGTVGDAADFYRSLTGVVSGNSVTLYMIRKISGAPEGNGEIVSLTDNTGHGGIFTGTPTLVATRPLNNTGFRGISIVPAPPSVSVSTKIFLQGAYNSGVGRHKDVTTAWANVLNTTALNQPYNVAPFNYTGTENVSTGFFTSTGATTDIVDWVLLELHDATTPSTIIARKAVFVREDGKIVDLDGISDPSFNGVGAKNYYVVIRHRNHLAVRSSSTVFINGAAPVLYDFTTAQSKAFQNVAITSNAAMKDFSGVFCMWSGNANMNTNVRYTGLSNDAAALLSALSGNQAAVLNNIFHPADLNLDGTVRYTGLNNDAAALLSSLSGNQAAVLTEHQ